VEAKRKSTNEKVTVRSEVRGRGGEVIEGSVRRERGGNRYKEHIQNTKTLLHRRKDEIGMHLTQSFRRTWVDLLGGKGGKEDLSGR